MEYSADIYFVIVSLCSTMLPFPRLVRHPIYSSRRPSKSRSRKIAIFENGIPERTGMILRVLRRPSFDGSGRYIKIAPSHRSAHLPPSPSVSLETNVEESSSQSWSGRRSRAAFSRLKKGREETSVIATRVASRIFLLPTVNLCKCGYVRGYLRIYGLVLSK